LFDSRDKHALAIENLLICLDKLSDHVLNLCNRVEKLEAALNKDVYQHLMFGLGRCNVYMTVQV